MIVTRQTAALARDPSQPNALLWNPLGATLEKALKQSGVTDGIVAIIGGPEVFSQFLPLYDAFHLSRAANSTLPGGLPVFTEVGPHLTPDDVLARHGLRPGARRDLDSAAGVSVVTWERVSTGCGGPMLLPSPPTAEAVAIWVFSWASCTGQGGTGVPPTVP